MKLEIARVILFVKDVDRMLTFYRDVLGLKAVGQTSKAFVSLAAGACKVSLHAIPKTIAARIVIDDPPKRREDSVAKMAFYAKDVASARATLVARGASMGKIRRAGRLALCDGIDPEGNVFQISNRIE